MVQFGKLKIGTDEVALERTRGATEIAKAQAEADAAQAAADAEDSKYWAQKEKEEAAEASRIAAINLTNDQVHNIEVLSELLVHYCNNGFECNGKNKAMYEIDFQIYSTCMSKLEAIFSVEENKQKYQKQYIKFLEIKALHKLTNFRRESYDKYGEVTFDNYGKAAKHVKKEVQKMLLEENLPVGGYSISASSTGQKRFWTDWGTGKKVGYVILNIYTFCIPVIIHIIVFFIQRALNKSDNKTAGSENQK